MATQTETKLAEHDVALTSFREQVGVLRAEVDELRPLLTEVVALRAELASHDGDSAKLRAAETDIALLKHQIAELAKAKDTWGGRVWQIVAVVLSAFFATLTAVLGTLLAFTLNAKK